MGATDVMLQFLASLIAPASELGKQYLVNKAAEGGHAAELALEKLARIRAGEERKDKLAAAEVDAKIALRQREIDGAFSLDAQQLAENRNSRFDEWYVAFISIPLAVCMWDGIAGTGYAMKMVEAFVALPVWYQAVIASIVFVKVLAMRAMIRWAVRLWLEFKAGKKVALPEAVGNLSDAKADIEKQK